MEPVCHYEYPVGVFCSAVGKHECAGRANRVCDFVQNPKIIVHTKGRHARKPFLLAPWQQSIIRPLFGMVQFDPQLGEYVRTYTTAWIELARKNGKSEILSALALYMLCGDGEESPEVYSVAADKDQAALVFNTAKRMVELSPALSKMLTVVDSRKRIVNPKNNGIYAVLPGDAAGALGTNPSCVLFDEVLTQKDRHLWDAMRQGFGTRKSPMLVAATTASYTSATFCLEEHDFSERVALKPDLDPRRFVFQRNVPRDWDWRDEGQPGSEALGIPATGWYWANPALGDFLSLEALRSEAKEAAEKPQAQNSFRVFRLNQWVSQAVRWLDMTLWDRNNTEPLDREDYKGAKAYAGLDLASTSDFTAWVVVVPADEGYKVFPRFYIPRPMVEKRSAMRSMFEVWERDGAVVVTDGEAVDYDRIFADIQADLEHFNIAGVGYDPWNAVSIIQQLEAGEVTCVKVPQTTVRLNAPSKEIERLLANNSLSHAGDPVLRWMVDNVEALADPEGNIKPSKKKSAEKIDGVIALCNALFVALLPPEAEAPVAGFFTFDDMEALA